MPACLSRSRLRLPQGSHARHVARIVAPSIEHLLVELLRQQQLPTLRLLLTPGGGDGGDGGGAGGGGDGDGGGGCGDGGGGLRLGNCEGGGGDGGGGEDGCASGGLKGGGRKGGNGTG